MSSQPHPNVQVAAEYCAAFQAFAREQGLHPDPPAPRRAARLSPGGVAEARTLQGLERAAANLETKAVSCQRGKHVLAADIAAWTDQQHEDDCCSFAKENIEVVHSNGIENDIRPEKRRRLSRSGPSSLVSADTAVRTTTGV